MYSIAFFWVGEDISIPKRLVDSIRLVMGSDVEVIQLTDLTTAGVAGVTKVQRSELSSQIMVARLQAYAQTASSQEFTFFCDADSIFISPLNIQTGLDSQDIFLTERLQDHAINDKYPEFYPEFTGKMIKDVMPILFGAIAVKGNQSGFFDYLLTICKQLPMRFQRWYGDQYALASLIKNEQFKFGLLDPNRHLFITRSEISEEDIVKLQQFKVQMVTFKGPDSKQHIENTFKNLLKTLNKTA